MADLNKYVILGFILGSVTVLVLSYYYKWHPAGTPAPIEYVPVGKTTYTNKETWTVVRDEEGRLSSVEVHRHAQTA